MVPPSPLPKRQQDRRRAQSHRLSAVAIQPSEHLRRSSGERVGVVPVALLEHHDMQPPSASSAATTAPPAPAPITQTSASMRSVRAVFTVIPQCEAASRPSRLRSAPRVCSSRSRSSLRSTQRSSAGYDLGPVPAKRAAHRGIVVAAERRQDLRELVERRATRASSAAPRGRRASATSTRMPALCGCGAEATNCSSGRGLSSRSAWPDHRISETRDFGCAARRRCGELTERSGENCRCVEEQLSVGERRERHAVVVLAHA